MHRARRLKALCEQLVGRKDWARLHVGAGHAVALCASCCAVPCDSGIPRYSLLHELGSLLCICPTEKGTAPAPSLFLTAELNTEQGLRHVGGSLHKPFTARSNYACVAAGL